MSKKVPCVTFASEKVRMRRLKSAALWGRLDEQLTKDSEDDHSKLLLLCRQYGIEEDEHTFYHLAMALARELYPEPKKRGRKSKWTMLNKGALVVEVERLVRPNDPAHGVEWACNLLSKRERWASFLEAKERGTLAPDPGEALRRIYFDFRDDNWANVSRKAFKMYEHDGAIERWEKIVVDVVRNPHPK